MKCCLAVSKSGANPWRGQYRLYHLLVGQEDNEERKKRKKTQLHENRSGHFFYQLAKRVSTIKYRHQILIFLFVCSFFYFPLHSTLSSSSLCLFSLFSSLTLPLLLFTLSPHNTLSLLVTVLIITAYLQSNKTCATLWIPSFLDTIHPYPIHLHCHHLDHLHRHLLEYCLQSHASFSLSSSLGVHCSHSFVLRCTSQEIHNHNSGTVQKKRAVRTTEGTPEQWNTYLF